MPIFGREDFWGEKTPLKIAILGGRIFGEGGSASPLLPIYQFSKIEKKIPITQFITLLRNHKRV